MWHKRRLTTMRKLMNSQQNGKRALMTSCSQTSQKCATMTSILFSKTWWKRASFSFLEIDKFGIYSKQNLSSQLCQSIRKNSPWVCSRKPAFYQFKSLACIWLLSATSATTKKSATSCLEPSTASTSAIWTHYPAILSQLFHFANSLKTYCRCTNPKCVSIWISWEFRPLRLRSPGFTSLFAALSRLTKFSWSWIEFLVLNAWIFCPF